MDGPPEAPEPVDAPAAAGSGRTPRRRSPSATGQKWMRLVHVYTSMIAMLVVLFFGATGLTLNHPNWTFGFRPTTSHVSGTLPKGSVDASGAPVFLTISEGLRDERNLRGTVTDFGVTGSDGFITYHGPGYQADVTFDAKAGTYRADIEQQGLIGVLNDLHKGRNTSGSWGWVIDLSAAFLVVISLTGIGLQLFLRRRRRAAVIVALLGGLATVVLAVITVR